MINKFIHFDDIYSNINLNCDFLVPTSEILNNNPTKEINNYLPNNLPSSLDFSKKYILPFDYINIKNISEITLNNCESNLINITYEIEKENQSYEIEQKENENKSIDEILINDLNNKKNNMIFNIEKKIKKGRHKKYSNKKGKHDKYKRDNLIRRFKVHLMSNIFKYINNSFDVNNPAYKTKIKVLKKISSYKIKSISKKDNIKWLNSKIKDVFSQDISTKIVTCAQDHNIKLIKRIINKGKDEKVIYILNNTIRNLWKVYLNDDKNNEFSGFETLKDDINKLRKLGETEEYISNYVKVAQNFEEIFNRINPREKRNLKK